MRQQPTGEMKQWPSILILQCFFVWVINSSILAVILSRLTTIVTLVTTPMSKNRFRTRPAVPASQQLSEELGLPVQSMVQSCTEFLSNALPNDTHLGQAHDDLQGLHRLPWYVPWTNINKMSEKWDAGAWSWTRGMASKCQTNQSNLVISFDTHHSSVQAYFCPGVATRWIDPRCEKRRNEFASLSKYKIYIWMQP